ncbi:hypothetical protein KI387_011649 [Taxus chinensis]|uniref:protein-serine/threonine phosphatase n=1 Tax=Taxus chinensis TaxID=29808 RepID=A0AA38CEY5_TAXCH|nr:hypothetical protein KI387_011649 [Taxus chinensis]
MAMEAICINPNRNFLKPVNRDGCFKRSMSLQPAGNNIDGTRYELNSEIIRPARSLSIPAGIIVESGCRVNAMEPSANPVQSPRPGRQFEPQGNPDQVKVSHAEQMKKKISNGDSNIIRANSESISGSSMDLCPSYGMMSVIGRRREMEDTVAIVPWFYKGFSSDLHFFGVYDGHGGSEVSVFCRKRLHRALAQELTALLPSGFDNCRWDPREWEKAMRNCFTQMDIQVGGMCPTGKCHYEDNTTLSACCKDPVAPVNVGSTAVVAVVSRSQIVVANCGDSRAVLFRGGKAVPFSQDQKPEREDEMNRIEAAGGQIVNWNGYRVGGFLAMSRAIGDRFLKQYVISEPEVTCGERTEEDEFLILASDGLWDVVSNEFACELVEKCLSGYRPRRVNKGMNEASASAVAVAASVLTRLAVAHGSTDNISVIVIDLNNKRRRRNHL